MSFLWFKSEFEKEEEQTRELYERVRFKTIAIYNGNDNFISDLIADIAEDIENDDLRESVTEGLTEIAIREGSYTLENDFPNLSKMNDSERVEFRNRLRRKEAVLNRGYKSLDTFKFILRWLTKEITENISTDDRSLYFTPIYALKRDLMSFLDTLAGNIVCEDMQNSGLFWDDRNALLKTAIQNKKYIAPSDVKADSKEEILQSYFGNTSFFTILTFSVAFAIPKKAREEHTHVLGGTGHGKTELLKTLIVNDFLEAMDGERTVLVMDSQGDLINSLSSLQIFEHRLFDNVIIIDPSDIEYPPELNLFALNVEGDNSYLKEKKIQSAVAIYTYLFTELLGAELTARQGATFSFLARLIVEIKGATIHTLKDILENGHKYKKEMERLEGSAGDFFRSAFFSTGYAPVKTQIINRLWAILGNGTLDRMFSHKNMKLNLGLEFQRSKVIFINTAKSFLKEEHSKFFGKFILSLINHAMVERADIKNRLPVSIYIDEAHEYLDQTSENLFVQARKYGISLTIAHQNLDQLGEGMRNIVASNTSVKIAGGVSHKDALAIKGDMRTTTDFLLNKRKQKGSTEFAIYIKNHLHEAIEINAPLGQVDSYPKLSKEAKQRLFQNNRQKYCALKLERKTHTKEEKEEPKLRAEEMQGRGGDTHKRYQKEIKKQAEDKGYIARIEHKVTNGFIDVFLEKENEKIAIEIAINTDVSYEVKNIQKCISSSPSKILIISNDEKHLEEIKALAEKMLIQNQQIPIFFITPEKLENHLTEKEEPLETVETTTKKTKGFTVKVSKVRRRAAGEL